MCADCDDFHKQIADMRTLSHTLHTAELSRQRGEDYTATLRKEIKTHRRMLEATRKRITGLRHYISTAKCRLKHANDELSYIEKQMSLYGAEEKIDKFIKTTEFQTMLRQYRYLAVVINALYSDLNNDNSTNPRRIIIMAIVNNIGAINDPLEDDMAETVYDADGSEDGTQSEDGAFSDDNNSDDSSDSDNSDIIASNADTATKFDASAAIEISMGAAVEMSTGAATSMATSTTHSTVVSDVIDGCVTVTTKDANNIDTTRTDFVNIEDGSKVLHTYDTVSALENLDTRVTAMYDYLRATHRQSRFIAMQNTNESKLFAVVENSILYVCVDPQYAILHGYFEDRMPMFFDEHSNEKWYHIGCHFRSAALLSLCHYICQTTDNHAFICGIPGPYIKYNTSRMLVYQDDFRSIFIHTVGCVTKRYEKPQIYRSTLFSNEIISSDMTTFTNLLLPAAPIAPALAATKNLHHALSSVDQIALALIASDITDSTQNLKADNVSVILTPCSATRAAFLAFVNDLPLIHAQPLTSDSHVNSNSPLSAEELAFQRMIGDLILSAEVVP